jgi:Xaa-Pro dipeptidase
MSIIQQTQHVPTPQSSMELNLAAMVDRRTDVEAKQLLVARILHELGCEGLLILEPENFYWLTSGGTARGILDPRALPCLYFTAEARWVISSSADSQRLFDEELDGLGFQLKEWPWHWGRAQLLADLCQGKTVACDLAISACKPAAEVLRKHRCRLTEYEKACYRALGQLLAHALEATGRTLNRGESEREVAGQLSHRLYHRGAYPILISVAADGRSRVYRQGGFTNTAIRHYAFLMASARKYGLCATASRMICFEQMDPQLRQEYDAACRVSATYMAGSWPDAIPKQILVAGRRIYQLTGAEHEWQQAPQGHITGHTPVVLNLTPSTEELLQSGWAVTWFPSVGAACCGDTFLITDDGPISLTPAENWPLKRIRVQGAEFLRPDILVR